MPSIEDAPITGKPPQTGASKQDELLSAAAMLITWVSGLVFLWLRSR